MKRKLISLLLVAVSAVSMCLYGCGTSPSTEKVPEGPDYSDSKKQFDFYGYSAAFTGEWSIDGVKYYAGEDYRTVERFQEYKDCGMNIMFPQHAGLYNGEEWETSMTKNIIDMAMEVGIERTIINDIRIQTLSRSDGGIIGEGKKFASEEELDATIASYMAPYKDYPGFYGVMLGDEPFYYMVESYGQVYNSIKRVAPNCFVQYNLNPITAGVDPLMVNLRFPKLEEGESEGLTADEILVARYEKYVTQFLDATGTHYIQYDQYPLKKANEVDPYYILGLQVVAELAKERDLEFYFVSQTYGQYDAGNPRMLKEADLYWINNMLLGFGVKTISYFTYWTKSDNNTEHFVDGNSFVTWYGEKTKIYYWMQRIMEEEQKFAPVILNFDYLSSKTYVKAPTVFSSLHVIKTIETQEFNALKNVDVNKEVALVTELYDAEKDNYMYMVQNVIDPVQKGSKAYQTVELTFGEGYNYAAVYVKGERTCVKLNDGKLIVKQHPGHATYVIPYK